MPGQRTHEPLVASIVHIAIDRRSPTPLSVAPDPVHAFYLHGGGGGDPMRPHSVLWEVFGLLPGERIEIEASRVTDLARSHDAEEVLRTLVETSSTASDGPIPSVPARTPRTGQGFVWTIPHGASSVESVEFAMPSHHVGLIVIKYDVRLFMNDVLSAHLDPGVHLIPDP